MIKMSANNNIYILLTTENGNGYANEECQKIVIIANDDDSIQKIFEIFYIMNRNNTRNKRLLKFNIIDYDLTVMNIDYLGKYEELVDFKQTHIISIDADNDAELSAIMINVFEHMQQMPCIKQLLYSRRKKYNGTKKVFFFLIKVFIDKETSIEEIKSTVLPSHIIINKKMKLKVNDFQMDKQNKNEQGVKKNNWENI